ncbi:Flavorubredoxin [Pseudomonas syringae pv. actinidiae]|uniref:Flavorubredoxin n=1 Tax=Pseudomonas syringae pv. actinidiae TaxID=103796 RepID=A0AAN4QCF1_PSESF|nr:Flavorubredoxin [Pseudomonas syringae pv. actinidiae]
MGGLRSRTNQSDQVDLISNRLERSHLTVITELKEEAQSLVICSGWIKRCGLKLLLPSLDKALNRGVAITIFTNARHTSPWCISALADRPELKHVS